MDRYFKSISKTTFQQPYCNANAMPPLQNNIPSESPNMYGNLQYGVPMLNPGNLQVVEQHPKDYAYFTSVPQPNQIMTYPQQNEPHFFQNFPFHLNGNGNNLYGNLRNDTNFENNAGEIFNSDTANMTNEQIARKHARPNFRHSPYGCGSNKSNSAVIPDADGPAKIVAATKNPRQKDEETFQDGDWGNLNLQTKVQEKPSETAVVKVSTAETSAGNKRHSSGGATAKSDKQKSIHTSGMRVFSGNIEKLLKWYKILRPTPVDCVIEVVAKCIGVRPGEHCQKYVLLRDSSGPVLQVVYYEIDFMLPNIEIGSSVRVVGKMVAPNRMVAYKIRPEMPFEGAMIPRLGAISQHIITKIQTAFSSH